MKIICAEKNKGEYVVPDYIYVSLDYSFNNPKKPYLMIETKNPILINYYYRDLKDFISNNYDELKAEIEACGYVIFTDGITWMFLKLNNDGKIIESEDYKTIRLVNKFESYYKTNRISIRRDIKQLNLDFMGEGVFDIQKEPDEWNNLKEQIN